MPDATLPADAPMVPADTEALVRQLLTNVGDDPQRGGLLETPGRVAKAWAYWMRGLKATPEDEVALLKCFEDGAEAVDEMVLSGPIPLYSHCEHHLAPFFGEAYIGYLPQGRVVGLSKLTRYAQLKAARPQVQERLTQQIATGLMEHLAPLGVAVITKMRHLCMESRGVQTQITYTTNSKMLGVFKHNMAPRAEFLELVKIQQAVPRL